MTSRRLSEPNSYVDQLRESEAPEASTGVKPNVPIQLARWRRIDLADLGNRYGLIFVWLVVIVIFSALRPDVFLTPAILQSILGSQAVLLIVTLGLLLPLTAGEFDVSVAGVLSIALVLMGYLNIVHHWPVVFAILVALATGVAVGLVNSFFVIVIRLHSFVVTLGTGTLLSGLAIGINNQSISGISDVWVQASRGTPLLGLPFVFYYGLLLTVALWYTFAHLPLGRYLFFVGAGRDVARLSGIRVDRVRTGAFVGASLIGAVAGVLLAGVLGGADPNVGPGYLLPGFAAAFLGATTITPGRFNPWGGFVAVYFLVTGFTGLEILGLSGWIEQVFYGGALVLAITFSQLSARRTESRGATA